MFLKIQRVILLQRPNFVWNGVFAWCFSLRSNIYTAVHGTGSVLTVQTNSVVHFTVNGHWNYVQFDTIMNEDVMDTRVRVSWWTCAVISSSEAAEQCRYCQTALQSGCTNHSSIQQNMRVLISLHSHELLDLSVFSIIVIPVDVL